MLLNYPSMCKPIRIGIGGLLLILSSSSFATVGIGDKTKISGFGTLALTYSNSDDLGFRRDLTQDGLFNGVDATVDSLIGVQFDDQFASSWKGTLQLVGKQRAVNDFNNSIEWAYLTYQNSDDWTARIGRVAIDITLFDEFSNVSYAYDWVRPPVEFYGEVPIYSVDGGDFTYYHHGINGISSFKLIVGNSSRHYQTLDFDMHPLVAGAYKFETNNLIYRASMSHTTISHFFSGRVKELKNYFNSLPLLESLPESQDILSKLDLNRGLVDYYSLGIDYRSGNWRWLGELSYLDTDVELLIPTVAMYGGVVRRFSGYSLFSTLSHTHSTKSTYQPPTSIYMPPKLSQAAQLLFDFTDMEQTTLSIGTRWDIAQNLDLKFQWDSSWVDKNESLLWSGDSDSSDAQRVDVITLSLDFVF
jgi:hypothetical protein